MSKSNKSKSNVLAMMKADGVAAGSLRQSIQLTIIATLSHFALYGDPLIEQTTDYIKSLSGTRGDKIAKMFREFGGYTTKVGVSGFTGHKGVEFVKANLASIKGESGVKWWELGGKDDAFRTMTLENDLDKMLKRYDREQKKADKAEAKGEGHNTVNQHLSEAIIQRFLQGAGRVFDPIIIHSDNITVLPVAGEVAGNDDDTEEEAEVQAA